MRSTQKEAAVRLREVREMIGARTNNEAWVHIGKATVFFEKRLPLTAITISPYRHGMWTLSGFIDNQWVSIMTDAEEMLDSPMSLVKRAKEYLA